MSTQLADVLGERLPLIYSAVAILAATFAVQYLLRRHALSGIPVIGAELGGEQQRREAYQAGASNLYKTGYQKFRESIARITTSDSEHIIVPVEFLDELKKLPEDVLGFSDAIEETMVAKYTGLDSGETRVAHIVRANLTPSLPRVNPLLAEEVMACIRQELPSCKDWTEVNLNSKLLRIVAIVSGRVFLGPETCHDERYIEAAINYTVDLIAARNRVVKMRPWLRPFLARSLPEVKRLAEQENTLQGVLEPVVTARLKAQMEDPGYEKPDDMLQWLIDARDEFEKKGNRAISKLQLSLSFAAIHTTTLTVTNAFYTIAAKPELVPELREECSNALAESNGVFSSAALQRMKKVDSFLKETMRVYPLSMGSFGRKTLKPVRLSNGQVIPAGKMLEVSSYGVYNDPKRFPNPNEFDAFRFYRMREQGEGGSVSAAAHNQFVSVNHNSLTFGYGRHACPGRFFAANETKMIFARVLLQYDVKLAGGATERYPNIEMANSFIPDPRKMLLFKEVA